eukprot:m.201427 g.201427  ORF g.201427 m.201427 type:complete len:243 (+) comp25229_c2_seq1:97-825(+)
MADQLACVVETGIGAAVVGGVLFGAVLGGRSCGALPATLLDRPVALWQAVVAGGVLAYMGARASTMMGSEDDLWEDLDDDADESEDESGSEDEGDSDDEDDFGRLTADQKAALRGSSKAMAELGDVECKMVILVRKDIKMDKGKIAAQCGHAVLGCYRIARKYQPEMVRMWFAYGQTKIALKVESEKDMDMIMRVAWENGLTAVPIRDAGRTQVAAGTKTVLGIGPAPKEVINLFTGHLKLL